MKARFILFATVVAMASVAAAVGADTASASTYVASGSPGYSTFGATLGYHDMGVAHLVSGKITADPSPAYSGTQIVAIRWRVWRLVGASWTLDGEFTRRYTVYPNQYVSDPGFTARGMSAVYATDITITWRTPGGGLIGGAYRDLIHSSDYLCYTWHGCSIFWNAGQYALVLS
jgi:hypothetical protein